MILMNQFHIKKKNYKIQKNQKMKNLKIKRKRKNLKKKKNQWNQIQK